MVSRKIKDSEFIQTDKDAAKRYSQWHATDPFPNVKPALLHSGQIRDYILTTGMLAPFTRDDLEDLKPASLEIPFEGRVVYWDESRKKHDEEYMQNGCRKKRVFILKRNSIAFVQVRPRFRLPWYIAIRFNLKIKHVHRGLLLGTGPLVDPGYQGHLFIPLHNLTDNDYPFTAGKGLLWMEFTKLQWTCDGRSGDDAPSREGDCAPEGYKQFPPKKMDLPLEEFFDKAYDNNPILSSIPQEISRAKKAAERAKKIVYTLASIGGVAGLALVIGLLSLIHSTARLTGDVKKGLGVQSQQVVPSQT